MESGSLKIPLQEARIPSSFTFGLLLSTSVAVFGSFCYGCAVRFHHLFLFSLFSGGLGFSSLNLYEFLMVSKSGSINMFRFLYFP